MIRNIILDLDETLISALLLEEIEDEKRKCLFPHHNMDDQYIVFERPHVQPFLDFLFSNYRVSVWTAATKRYALFVIEKVLLKPGRELDLILYSDHCTASSHKTGCSKFLNELFHLPGYTRENTLIIDDNDLVHDYQDNKTIKIKAFEFNDADAAHDTELLKIMKSLE